MIKHSVKVNNNNNLNTEVVSHKRVFLNYAFFLLINCIIGKATDLKNYSPVFNLLHWLGYRHQ
jgi:hypothetical protein